MLSHWSAAVRVRAARQESSVLTLVLVNTAWSQMDASPLPQFLQKKRKEKEENEGAEKGQKYLN